MNISHRRCQNTQSPFLDFCHSNRGNDQAEVVLLCFIVRAFVQWSLSLCNCENYAHDRHTFVEVTKDIDRGMSD